jgi:hypothetical protein
MKIDTEPARTSLERARDADLVTLPPDIPGTNCANCKHIDGNICRHKLVAQVLDNPKHQCCIYWDRPGTKRAWERR